MISNARCNGYTSLAKRNVSRVLNVVILTASPVNNWGNAFDSRSTKAIMCPVHLLTYDIVIIFMKKIVL